MDKTRISRMKERRVHVQQGLLNSVKSLPSFCATARPKRHNSKLNRFHSLTLILSRWWCKNIANDQIGRANPLQLTVVHRGVHHTSVVRLPAITRSTTPIYLQKDRQTEPIGA